ncbi:unnamed protein product [Arabis nemorensis]|uniref:non-specific serine/threonine protein kinase n=1 Tax=Arabis nemorensis TaxID=586526 RepID=A0A565ALN0_9BRAS|nr:unnamed protein product [Arabis nemorensis]
MWNNSSNGLPCYFQHFPCLVPKRKWDDYTVSNTSTLSIKSPSLMLYKTARVSPLVLTHYGLSLGNGLYNVSLHFAEIIFTNDITISSLGKRVFDIYVQEKLMIKSFTIKEAAGGSGKPIVKTFLVNVTDHNLKISLRWAGKGTTSLPRAGVYGPMILAISVEPNFKRPMYHDKKKILQKGGIFVEVVFVVLLIVVIFFLKRRCAKNVADKELRGLDLQSGNLTLEHIKVATNNFDLANKIGEGGFDPVCKDAYIVKDLKLAFLLVQGVLPDGKMIAVKQLSSTSRKGSREFLNEIGMISSLRHPNLVKLYGCCVDKKQLMLVYEYLENNCLSRALFGNNQSRMKLDWLTRKKICLGITRGITFLHEGSAIKVVHRDIKTSNVLLDKHLNSKISDCGLAKLGYVALEYLMTGLLTEKADVYSFGVVALEIVSGRYPKHQCRDIQSGCLLELVDPNLDSNYSENEATVMLNMALMCTNMSSLLRPHMSEVVNMLSDPNFSVRNPELKALRKDTWQSEASTSGVCTTQYYGPEEYILQYEISEMEFEFE